VRTTRRGRRPGPDPKPREERRSILVGVKVSPREYGAFRTAAGSLAVATWMRGRALEALEVRSARERADIFLTQAKAFRDRADEVLGEMDREFSARVAAVDQLLARVSGRSRAPATERRGGEPSDPRAGTRRRK
jgi:hypothetical protein